MWLRLMGGSTTGMDARVGADGAEMGGGTDPAGTGVHPALRELSPFHRAVLELRYRHGRSPAEISLASGLDEPAVERWRLDALQDLGAKVGVEADEAGRRMEEAFARPGKAPGAVPAPVPSGKPLPVRRESPLRRLDSSRERGFAALAVAGLLAGAVGAAVTTRDSGSAASPVAAEALTGAVAAPVEARPSNEPGGVPSAAEPPEDGGAGGAGAGPTDGAGESAARSAYLTTAPDYQGRGSSGVNVWLSKPPRLALYLKGLPRPDGRYQLWLYNSDGDSKPLGSLRSGSGNIEARLPPEAADYRFLDVSLQRSGEETHSGRSRFRVPLSDLLSPE